MLTFLIPSLWFSLKRLLFRLSSHHSTKTGLIKAATDHPSLSAPFPALTLLTGQPASLSNSLPGLLASLGGGLLFSFSCTCFSTTQGAVLLLGSSLSALIPVSRLYTVLAGSTFISPSPTSLLSFVLDISTA